MSYCIAGRYGEPIVISKVKIYIKVTQLPSNLDVATQLNNFPVG